MEREATCVATWEGRRLQGKALLETDSLVFRGDARFDIPLAGITSVSASEGRLSFESPQGSATLEIGVLAEKWAEAIRNPRTRMDKLGVKAGAKVCVEGIDEPGFADELKARGGHVYNLVGESRFDLIFYQADSPAELSRMAELRGRMRQDGAIWVVTPRGRPEIVDVVVMAAGKAAGLVDVRVCRFNETHTALKFVIPKAERKFVPT